MKQDSGQQEVKIEPVLAHNPAGLSVDAVKPMAKKSEAPGDDRIEPEAKKMGQTSPEKPPKKPSNTPVITIILAISVCISLIGLTLYLKTKN